MPTQLARRESNSKTDYSILIKRVKAALAHNESGEEDALALLKKRSVWQNLPPDDMAEWAYTALIGGEIALSLEICEHLTQNHPDCEKGWRNYLTLLSNLDHREALAVQTARAKAHIATFEAPPWHDAVPSAPSHDTKDRAQKEDAAALSPVETMMEKRSLMTHYLSLFSGRKDTFARQWADKSENKSGYVPVRRAMTLADVEDHLNGVKTYGIYLLDEAANVRCGVIDADVVMAFRSGRVSAEKKRLFYREKGYMISRINDASKEAGLTPLLEFSGNKGYHFWYFFKESVAASRAKSLLESIADPVKRDLSCFDLEVFPKQDQLKGKGLGNLVKLPLGIHRKSGKPSCFLECKKRDLESQLRFLKGVTPADSCEILQTASTRSQTADSSQTLEPSQTANMERIVLHPRMATFAREYPELYDLERLCPPIGQILAACREGKALSNREEKVLFQTIGFLPRRKLLMHYLLASGSEYNPHMVDFKLGKVRGTPLGCRRIHSLLGFQGDDCPLKADSTGYLHPLIHLEAWRESAEKKMPKSERIENLQAALENMKAAIVQVERFLV